MNAAELDALLRQFLVDGKLSKSERTTLTAWVQGNIATDQQRAVARSRVFEAARAAVADPQANQIISFLEDVLKVIAPPLPAGGGVAEPTSEVAFSPGDTCLGMIVNHLGTCRRTADLCVFTITDDRIASAVLAAHKRGVKLRIITDNDKAEDLGSDIPTFLAAKIPLLVDRTPFHMHHKFAIFDGTHLLNGSYNWTRGAARDNMENLVDTADPKLIAAFQREFDAIWEKLS
jgi:phosphatidylserine/phosphatidylglycerophosphate/cardiolipin synthase-like enzyme